MFILSIEIFATLFLFANGLDLEFGVCPEPKAIDNIDIEQLSGTWYEIEKFPVVVEDGGRCGYIHITKLSDSEITTDVHTDYDNREESLDFAFNASLLSNKDGRFFVDVQVDIAGFVQPILYVLDTDYKNYLAFWSCLTTEIKLINLKIAWIFARNRTLPEETITKIHEKYNEQNLKTKRFVRVDQDNCE